MDITGYWYNELGSTMQIDSVVNGQFTGSYTTAVSSGGCAQGSHALVGQTYTDSDGEVVGFVVCWPGCQAVTAWSGQAQTINGNDQIAAFWLLTCESSPDQDWYATHIGQDLFTRTPPHTEQMAETTRAMRRSHP